LSWNFLAPERLWLLLGVVLLGGLYIMSHLRRRQRALRFTNTDLLRSIAPRNPGWRRHLTIGLMLCGLSVGVLGAARPYRIQTSRDQRSVIMLVFDVSLSMMADDVAPSRFEAAKTAAQDFVDRVDPTIDVGFVSFSGAVAVEVSPTRDRGRVDQAIDRLDLGEGTAIGDALIQTTRAVQRAFDIEESDGSAQGGADGAPPETLPAAVVLLSDGETSVGTPTADGAQIAAAAGLPVYTISFGTPEGTIVLEDPSTGEQVREPVPVNTDELASVADTTGGLAYTAESASSLESAYSAISESLGSALGEATEMTVELTSRYVLVALALMFVAVALALWWLGGIA
jgi:Ca-activated chloride channel family protein